MTSGRLTMFITSVHVLVQAGIVRGKQLENDKSNLNLRSFSDMRLIKYIVCSRVAQVLVSWLAANGDFFSFNF